MENSIEIYQNAQNKTEIQVHFENETVWLNLNQISDLFGRDKSVVSRHLKHIFMEGELEEPATVAKKATVQNESGREVKRDIEFYNLDVIISVGYRVNSKQGTQFRIWATQRIKDHLLKGYTINEQRIKQLQDGFTNLEKAIQLIGNSGKDEELKLNEAKGLLEIISNYTQSFVLLNRFDSNNLTTEKLNETITYEIKYEEARAAIKELSSQLSAKKEATELFGNEKDDSFKGILGNVVQTFGGEYLYPSIEEQSAHLLYFIIKNHPFSDGNKRIGAFLFIWFLEKNKHRFKKSGEAKINDNGLTALALLVAQSDPADKELMIALIVNLINNR